MTELAVLPPRAARPAAAPPVRRLLLVGNTRSRKGRRGLAEAQEALRREGYGFDTLPLSPDQDLTARVRGRRYMVDAVAVAGGDGTLNAIAPALLETGLPLLVLPTGSANDLARTLRVPPALPDAVRLARTGELRTIDVGFANGRPFFNVANIGLGALVTENLDSGLKRRLGPLAYPVAALRTLRRARRFTARIRGAGWDVEVQTFQISVGNGRYYGGGTPIEAQAQIDDGQLDLYSLEVSDLLRLLALAPRLRQGRQRLSAQVRVGACTRFEVETRRRWPVSLDGEILTHTPVTFTISPQAVRVFAPAA